MKTTKEIAEQLGISLRHARRLRANNDPKIQPFERAGLVQTWREDIARECWQQVLALDRVPLAIRLCLMTKTGPEIAPETKKLEAVLKELRRVTNELHDFANAINPD